jgi:hypothetical protein
LVILPAVFRLITPVWVSRYPQFTSAGVKSNEMAKVTGKPHPGKHPLCFGGRVRMDRAFTDDHAEQQRDDGQNGLVAAVWFHG